jgi:hypothetical protein
MRRMAPVLRMRRTVAVTGMFPSSVLFFPTSLFTLTLTVIPAKAGIQFLLLLLASLAAGDDVARLGRPQRPSLPHRHSSESWNPP